VAELLWVDFTPQRSIFPLAKWVPNNTKAVKEGAGKVNGVPNHDYPADESKYEHELADVQGYVDAPITVKKMSGNIEECHPYIWRANPTDQEGKLRIDGIKFKKDENPGGTILIKIGDPDDKSEPLYTLTIAYSAEQKYDKGNTDAGRGHTWDFSTNPLQGLTWGLNQTQIEAGQTFTYPQADNNEIFHNSSNGGYAVEKNLGNYFSNYFGETISNYSNAADVMNRMPKNETINSDGWPASLLYDEIDHQDEHGISRSDWMFNFNLVNDGQLYDPIFVNKYDMEGDNADMIWNSEGMVFQTSSGQSGIFDEYTNTKNNGNKVDHTETIDPDRYIGIKEGGKFRIPWLMPNDRVIIYMGIGTLNLKEQAKFSIRNAFDAEHNIILPTDDYVVGGSHWDGEKGDPYYRGCYHFFAQGDGNGGPADMVFEMKEGPLCKIYSIQIYRGDRINTNEIKGATANDKFLLWSRDNDPNDGTGKDIGPTHNWTLQYFGKDQKIADGSNGVNNGIVELQSIKIKSGVNINDNGFTTSTVTDPTQPLYNTFTYQHDYGQIGTFRMRGKDMEKNMKYVADYGDHNVTVAYQQTMRYPYTWDFMDMIGYNSSNFSFEDAIGIGSSFTSNKPSWFDSDDEWNSSYEKSSTDLSLWEKLSGNNPAYDLRLNSQKEQGDGGLKEKDNIFETAKDIPLGGGNQVWANGAVVPETQGLWFYSYNNNQNNGKWGINSDGMDFGGTSKDVLKIVVPNVPANAAVYLRMVKNREVGADYAYEFMGGNTNLETYGPVKVDGTNDYILAIMNKGTAKRHLTLSIAGYRLKKLAVSTDPKAVNTKGWTSESRDHAIDAALTPYLTGKPIKTYFAGQPNHEKRTLVLADISNSANNHVMPAETGCVLFNEAAKDYQDDINYKAGKVEIFNGGFHLFVPDMHDGDKLAAPTDDINMLRPQLIEVKPLPEGDDTNTYYVLSYSYYNLDADGNPKSNTAIAGPEMFYRVAKTGIGLRANSAYLALPTSEVKPKNRGTVEAPAKCYSFVFADYDDFFASNLNGIATEIEGVETVTPQTVQEGWYTINGQKLSGRPTTSGLYIVNGKKVLVK
jgi:hypothetical protein